MIRETPKGRSPWSTLPVGTRVRIEALAMTGTVVRVRRKKVRLRYEVALDGPFAERLPILRAMRPALREMA